MRIPNVPCYWVETGRLLAGEYPRNHQAGEIAYAKLEALLAVGVTAFIDLTEDGECDPYAERLEGRASHQRFAIEDVSIPASKALTRQALEAIDAHLGAGDMVYVHCRGGIGRTGTIIGCWLARHLGGGQAGYDRLQALWAHCAKSAWTASPETSTQVGYILAWDEEEEGSSPAWPMR